ncbi:MAG: alpha/beta fold hydrolase [Planctomycetia bacterium]|nr:alpha/beta fold hydrolase [Planctomycetia bacterium]
MPTYHSCFVRVLIVPAAVAAWLLFSSGAQSPDESAPPSDRSIDGVWQGVLKASGVELRLVFRVAKDEQGQLTASMDSPDQGAKGIRIDTATLAGDDVRFEVKRIKGAFEGKLSADGREIKGQWKQLGPALALDLKRLDKEPDYSRPQEPKKPYPYAEEEVVYENATASVKLAGTLTLPVSDQSVPAVLMITGSGAQDRDETLLGHKPFLVLADYLTRRGIAVLRVDDRGVGGSTGDTAASTTDEFVGDVLAGVAYLKGRKEINPRRIGLIGHSEGGIIAPLAASRSADVAFIVMLAGTGTTGEEIVYRQGGLIAKAQGANDLTVAASRVVQRQIFKIVKEEPDRSKAEQQVRDVLATAGTLAAVVVPKETLQAQAETQVKAVFSPWFRFFLTYDPQPALRKVRCPVLAINGEKDLQVDPKQNLQPIEAALKEGGNSDYTLKELPGLNHLFQHCQTGSPSEYATIDETFAPEALELVAEWIRERTK